jgi:hypothetical protein
MEPLSSKPSPRKLTDEDYAWAAGVGISKARADWLASCPSNMRYGNEPRPKEERPKRPNRNMQRLGNLYYFRLRKDGRDIRQCLGPTLTAARALRDRLLAEYEAANPTKQKTAA